MAETKFVVGMFGGGGVGKTAITLQFVKGEFTDGYIPTIEDNFEKMIQVDGQSVNLDIIDTAGQDDFKELRYNYMGRIDGFIMVYSKIDNTSLDQLKDIHKDALQAKAVEYVPCVIAGNKADIDREGSIPITEGQRVGTEWKCNAYETSAKTCLNIQKLFEDIVRVLLNKDKVKNQKAKPAKSNNDDGGCCVIY